MRIRNLFLNHQDFFVGVLLALGGLASRLPFREKYIYHMDGVGYALAIDDFDILKDQPHPPGYPLYILMARAFNLILHDPHQSLVWLSILSSIGAVIGLYFLGKQIHSRYVGAAAALLLLVSPVFWFNSEISMSYAPEAFFVILTAYFFWRTIAAKKWRDIIFSGLFLGIAAGIRPTGLMFLFPLFLYSLWFVRSPWRKGLAGLLALGAAVASWVAPLIAFTGLKQFLETNLLAGEWAFLTSLAQGVTYIWGQNVKLLAIYFAFAFNFGALFLFRKPKTDFQKFWFLAVWALPALVFYFFVHAPNSGYLLLLLPAFILWIAITLAQKISYSVLALVLAANVAIFLGLPFETSFTQPLYANIRLHDQQTASLVSVIRQNFQPNSTLILDFAMRKYTGFRHAMWYLPEFPALLFGNASLAENRKIWHGRNKTLEFQDQVDTGRVADFIVLSPPDAGNIPIWFAEKLQVQTIGTATFWHYKNTGEITSISHQRGAPALNRREVFERGELTPPHLPL